MKILRTFNVFLEVQLLNIRRRPEVVISRGGKADDTKENFLLN